MELNYVVDITSAYNNVLMTYGDNYQVQRYTHGINRISMDFWMLDDHDNGWIPNGSEMNLSGERQRLYYLHDELGSVTKVIGENGKTSAHYNYDEFGRPLPSVKFDQNWPGPDNTFGYTGYQYDVSAELWYAQARYYMPEIGRFISEDPWSGTIMTPTTMNPYPYVLNNPLKYVDPLGLSPQPSWAGYPDAKKKIDNMLRVSGFYTGSAAHYYDKEIKLLKSEPAKVISFVTDAATTVGYSAYDGFMQTGHPYGAIMGAGQGVLDFQAPGANTAREEKLKRYEKTRANLGEYEWFMMSDKDRKKINKKLDETINFYEGKVETLNSRLSKAKDGVYMERNDNYSIGYLRQTTEELKKNIDSFNSIIDYAELIIELNSNPKESKNIINNLANQK